MAEQNMRMLGPLDVNTDGEARVAYDLMRMIMERNWEFYKSPDQILELYCRCAATVRNPDDGVPQAAGIVAKPVPGAGIRKAPVNGNGSGV